MVSTLKKFSREYIFVTILMSIMAHYDYESFPTRVPVDSLDHTIGDMFSFNQLMNNLLTAGESSLWVNRRSSWDTDKMNHIAYFILYTNPYFHPNLCYESSLEFRSFSKHHWTFFILCTNI